MADRRYMVGERVLVSRTEDGENHEEATVVDYYELLINEDSIPSIVVDFDDGERKYLTAKEPNVLELPDETEDEDGDDWDEEDDEEPAEADDDEGFGGGTGGDTPDED